MSIFDKIRNAVQPTQKGNTNLYTRDILSTIQTFATDNNLNFSGRYDNYYPNVNRIVNTAVSQKIYLTDKDGQEDTESSFAKVLARPNSSFPRRKILEQIYTELLTHGESQLFIWRDVNRNTTTTRFEKIYPADKFSGITLVSGYDQARLTRQDLEDIATITYGASQNNVFMGYSPTQAANAWRKMQDAMGLHSTSFAKNGGMPLGTFIITAKTPEDYVNIKNELEKRVVGNKNSGKVLFSYKPSPTAESQIQWVQFSSQDAQDYSNQLEFSDKKIDQNFGVPGTVKGTNDGENYATASVSRRSYMEYTIQPLVESLAEQLDFYLRQRFDFEGEIKSLVEIPDIADETLVKAEATTRQLDLYEKKLAEGYDKESVVKALGLPESFLLLELTNTTQTAEEEPGEPENKPKQANIVKAQLELVRRYQNTLTPAEMNALEREIRKVVDAYAVLILKNGILEENRTQFIDDMGAVYSAQYSNLYAKAVVELTDDLLELFDSIDIDPMKLQPAELEAAVKQYSARVDDFSKTFTENVDKLPGETLNVRRSKARPHVDRVVVSEAEHTRATSELDVFTKSKETYPVTVWKTWHTADDPEVCADCRALEDIQIDVTSLFDESNESNLYDVKAGLRHPNCRCWVTYEMERTDG